LNAVFTLAPLFYREAPDLGWRSHPVCEKKLGGWRRLTFLPIVSGGGPFLEKNHTPSR
jgi:hypothetical protein